MSSDDSKAYAMLADYKIKQQKTDYNNTHFNPNSSIDQKRKMKVICQKGHTVRECIKAGVLYKKYGLRPKPEEFYMGIILYSDQQAQWCALKCKECANQGEK